MKKWKRILAVSGLCSCAFAAPALASTNLETGSSLAGISVALNNFYAGNTEPEKQLASIYSDMETRTAKNQGNGSGSNKGASSGNGSASSGSGTQAAAQTQAAPKETKAAKPKSSPYDNIAVSKVNGSVNIRTDANTSSGVAGKIYNDSAATILGTVDGEGGKWYKIQSGSVTGYIKAEYFVTGEQAEAKARQVGTTYGTIVGTPSLRLRDTPNLEGKTLTLLSEGAHYVVTGEEGDFLKVSVDSDLEGYVFKEYMKTSVEFNKAVSVEEEKAKEAEEAKRKEEAEKALKALEDAKKKESEKKTTAASTKAEKTTEAPTTAAPKKEEGKPTDPVIQTIAANPENGKDATVAAPTTQKETEGSQSKGPGGGGSPSSEVVSATRNAVVAYAKQFLGNPYVYGGTSLTSGADCSGFTQSVFAHFGISTGRSSRDQAARGKVIPVSDVKPGDLLFYASGDYINHVAIYIGGGQIIHSSTPATGICIAPSNYRTPCKAVTFLD
ncbi:NlpC/P60 family protein [Enterocloster sp. OA13]|uniref:C40 family peptidase n=1 Tax=Enterocloster sp. OA13 TaxID=2914161 RepID=UPI0004721442|nr:NlpC/P60 family protein [Enterocloster sp. OA13]